MTFNFQTMKTKDPNLNKVCIPLLLTGDREKHKLLSRGSSFRHVFVIPTMYELFLTLPPSSFDFLKVLWDLLYIYWIIFPSCPWVRIFLFKCLHLRSSCFVFCLQLWVKKVPFGNRVMHKHWNESFLKNKVDSEDESRDFSIDFTV